MAEKKSENRIISDNRQARHDYFVLEALEAGIELVGTEVKSIRGGGANLKDSWCEIIEGQLYVNGMHVSPYEKGNIFNKDPRRVRRLLLHKSEIRRLYDKRDDMAKRQSERDIERALKERMR